MARLSTLSRSIAGRGALVTGAASGMGRATAHLFADEGAQVAVTDVGKEGVERVVDEIVSAGGKARGWVMNVADDAEVARVVPEIAAAFGRLDIVVNNAGISRFSPIDGPDYLAQWDVSLSVLLTAHVRVIRAALPFLRKSDAARIVNIASTEALGATKYGSPYTAAKSGVVGLTRSLAVELGPEKITVNCICPGPIRTGMTAGNPRGAQDDLRQAPRRAAALRRPRRGRARYAQLLPARVAVHHRRRAARRRRHDDQERMSGLTRREFLVTGAVAAGYTLAAGPLRADVISTPTTGLVAGVISIPVAGREIPGYRAKPAGAANPPIVLVVQEIFGVHEYIRDVCRRFAQAGYLAVAPDLYVRQGDVSRMTNFEEIRPVVAKVPDAQVMSDLDATAAWAEKDGGDGAKLAITGFCWGGRIVWLYSAHSAKLRAGVAWYGRLVGDKTDLQPSFPIDVAAEAPRTRARPVRRRGHRHPARHRRAHARRDRGGQRQVTHRRVRRRPPRLPRRLPPELRRSRRTRGLDPHARLVQNVRRVTRRFIVAALLSLALTAPTAATAGLVTWELEGTIELASPSGIRGGFVELHADELIPQLEAAGLIPGASWRARISFDSDTPAEPCEECGDYAEFIGATKSIDFLAGDFSAASPDGVVGNAGFASDLYFMSSVASDSATLYATSAVVVFSSQDPDALFATNLPTNPPDLAGLVGPTQHAAGHYYGTRFNLIGGGFVRNSDLGIFHGGPLFVPQSFTIDGRITSITPVPESSLVALLLGAAALLAIRFARTRAPPALLVIAVAWSGAASAGSVSRESDGRISQVAPREIAIPHSATSSRPNADEVVVLLEAIGVSSGPSWSERLAFEWVPPAEADAPDAAKSIEFAVGGLAMATPEGFTRAPAASDSDRAGGDSSTLLPTEPPYRGLALVVLSLLVLGSALALRRS